MNPLHSIIWWHLEHTQCSVVVTCLVGKGSPVPQTGYSPAQPPPPRCQAALCGYTHPNLPLSPSLSSDPFLPFSLSFLILFLSHGSYKFLSLEPRQCVLFGWIQKLNCLKSRCPAAVESSWVGKETPIRAFLQGSFGLWVLWVSQQPAGALRPQLRKIFSVK